MKRKKKKLSFPLRPIVGSLGVGDYIITRETILET
jgi:ERCC4-type nuclease